MIVHGGRNKFVLDDLFVLDLGRHEWATVGGLGDGGSPGLACHSHNIAVHTEHIYLVDVGSSMHGPRAGIHSAHLPLTGDLPNFRPDPGL